MPSASRPRGGDWTHRKIREQLLPAAIGKPCPFCRKPMREGQLLDLDHTVPLHAGGTGPGDRIAHMTCNRSRGAAEGNRKRKQPPKRRAAITRLTW